ncbi:MAG: amidohydrolase family protein, partial [Actinobacteria bacterium]|nr:amidohydrolase family protein [Actinomycetota bacterium]
MHTDHVFIGGRLFGAAATALAVSGDRIAAIGDDRRIVGLAGPGTRVLDLGGRLLTPGFIDAHVHPGTSGLDRLRVGFEDATDAPTAAKSISRYVTENPELPWIIGAGWSPAWYPRGCPDREALDGLVPDRPALLWNSDGHSAWANSAALAMAGIDAATPDPPDGRIERLDDGSPQGTLHEGAATLVERHAPLDGVADFERGLHRGQEDLLALGITGWQDANVFPELQQAYLRLAGDGRLKARVVGALWWDRHRGLEQIDELVERRRMDADRFSPTSVKLMLDGVAETFTASVLEPWLDESGRPTDNHGVDLIDPGMLPEIVTRLDGRGFQCHFHVIGDAAARHALDAIEAARSANGVTDNRHHLAHIQIV